MRLVLRSGVILSAMVLIAASRAPVAAATPQLIKVGTTPEGGRVTFSNVTRPESKDSVLFDANPIIRGDNLYAPDLVRVGDRWHCYHGGWLTSGQRYDRVYVGISAGLDPAGPWNPASQLAIHEGVYMHVNDPSVAIHDDVWYMVYTAFKYQDSVWRDWINYSTSSDGIQWTPSVATTATEIVLTDPNNIAGGPITDMARPSLVRTPTGWKMWFDGRVNHTGVNSYLAHSTDTVPSHFTLMHRYDRIEGFPGFYEPDVVLRPDGTYLAVVQRHFRHLYVGTSTDGINFTLTRDVSTTDPLFGRSRISNPGQVYDQVEDKFLGLSFGMTDNLSLVDHDIGFSASQYKVEVRSPGGVWHTQSLAAGLDLQSVLTPGYSNFDRVRITDPITNTVVLNQSFTDAAPGDLWYVHWDPAAPLIDPIEPDPGSVVERAEYVRPFALFAGQEPITWSLVEAPENAWIDEQGVVYWTAPPLVDSSIHTFIATFRVRAENAAGADERSWQVEVQPVFDGLPDFDGDGDVDMDDFGLLQSCLGIQNLTSAPLCAKADLNDNGRVDQADRSLWAGCISGPGIEADLDCLPSY